MKRMSMFFTVFTPKCRKNQIFNTALEFVELLLRFKFHDKHIGSGGHGSPAITVYNICIPDNDFWTPVVFKKQM